MLLQAELLAKELEMWIGGPEAFHTHLDRECLVAFPEVAEVLPKETIAQQAEEGRCTEIALDEKGFIKPSVDTAVLTYECRCKRNNRPYAAVVSSLYVKRGGDWRLAFHQQTPLDWRLALN